MQTASREITLAAAAAVCAVAGAVCDVRDRRIPNWLTLCSLLLGVLLHLYFGNVAEAGAALAAGLLVGAGFLLLHAAGGMGAGDVKLMAAVGCIDAWALLPPMLLGTALSAAALGIAMALYHGRLRATLRGTAHLTGGLWGREASGETHAIVVSAEAGGKTAVPLTMPFAVPVAAGCLYALYTAMRP